VVEFFNLGDVRMDEDLGLRVPQEDSITILTRRKRVSEVVK
jgi:hypothetical protein